MAQTHRTGSDLGLWPILAPTPPLPGRYALLLCCQCSCPLTGDQRDWRWGWEWGQRRFFEAQVLKSSLSPSPQALPSVTCTKASFPSPKHMPLKFLFPSTSFLLFFNVSYDLLNGSCEPLMSHYPQFAKL